MFKKYLLNNALSIAILLGVLALSFVPVVMMAIMSVRDSLSIQFDFWALPRLPKWSNYGAGLMFLAEPIGQDC